MCWDIYGNRKRHPLGLHQCVCIIDDDHQVLPRGRWDSSGRAMHPLTRGCVVFFCHGAHAVAACVAKINFKPRVVAARLTCIPPDRNGLLRRGLIARARHGCNIAHLLLLTTEKKSICFLSVFAPEKKDHKMKICGQYRDTPPRPIEDDAFITLWNMRQEVGKIIAQNPHGWRRVLNARDCTKNLAQRVQCINRAYFKCAELCQMVTVSPRTMVHLCEAPGGFAEFCSARYAEAEAAAFSLQSAGCIAFSPVVKCARSGVPNEGDICNGNVLRHIKDLFREGVDLVTADGGVQVEKQDIDVEEQVCTKLFLAQVVTTLSIQRVGGSCVIKFFEGATKATIDIVKVMGLFYERVEVTKPRTSRGTNSERYLVCNGFRKNDEAIKALQEIYDTMETSDRLYLSSVVDEELTSDDLQPFQKLASAQVEAIRLLISSTKTQNLDRIATLRKEDEAHVLGQLLH